VEWAFLLWRIEGSTEEARQVFQKNQQWYPESRHFWVKYLEFELAQPTDAGTESKHYERIKHIHQDMIKTSMTLETKKDISNLYLIYLQERGTKESMKEFLQIDRELNGPLSVQPAYIKTNEIHKGVENGTSPSALDEVTLRKGEVRYSTYFQQSKQLSANAQGLANFH